MRLFWVHVIVVVGLTFVWGGCGERSIGPLPLGSGGVSAERLSLRVDEVLDASLASGDSVMRSHALEVLALRGGLAGPAQIRRAFGDRVAAVRFAAAVAAGDMKDAAARAGLEKLLYDEDDLVKMAAGYALERLGDNRFGRWYDHALVDEDERLRSQACLFLGKLGKTPMRRDSVEVLWRVLRRRGQSASVRLEAAEALARLGDERILKPLIEYASSAFADDRLRAIAGLEAMGGADAEAMLAVLVDDEQPAVQLGAIRALGVDVEPEWVARGGGVGGLS